MEKFYMTIGDKWLVESRKSIYHIMKYQCKILITYNLLYFFSIIIHGLPIKALTSVGFYLATFKRFPVLFLKGLMDDTKRVSSMLIKWMFWTLITSRIELIETPFFDELSVKDLWPAFKTNKFIMKCIPNNKKDELPQR